MEIVFHGLSKHLKFRQKYSVARRNVPINVKPARGGGGGGEAGN